MSASLLPLHDPHVCKKHTNIVAAAAFMYVAYNSFEEHFSR